MTREGVVYTETVVHLAPARFAADVPYQVIIVKLDKGGTITARVEGDRVAIDDHVTEAETRDGISYFRKSND
ncbi:MAG: OB-fold domain-containing protein [Acidobacteriota bacterium]|nr:OB-fold domain-containing protein [Acidobacteriota bacterium]